MVSGVLLFSGISCFDCKFYLLARKHFIFKRFNKPNMVLTGNNERPINEISSVMNEISFKGTHKIIYLISNANFTRLLTNTKNNFIWFFNHFCTRAITLVYELDIIGQKYTHRATGHNWSQIKACLS